MKFWIDFFSFWLSITLVSLLLQNYLSFKCPGRWLQTTRYPPRELHEEVLDSSGLPKLQGVKKNGRGNVFIASLRFLNGSKQTEKGRTEGNKNRNQNDWLLSDLYVFVSLENNIFILQINIGKTEEFKTDVETEQALSSF